MPEPKLRRRDCRVVLALLTGAGNLSGYPLAKLAQVSAARVYRVLDLLEDAGHVAAHWEDGPPPRQRFYRLTPDGRAWAHRTLGLDQPKEAP
jgi:DNA-binding PadR family transcriptional regulator